MTRIGVIADTHIPDRAEDLPKKVIDDFSRVDMIVHAGDLVDLSVLDKLKSLCGNVIAVWGNMDPEAVRKKLPENEIITVGKYRLGLTHGSGHPSRLLEVVSSKFQDQKVDAVIFGHSHIPLNEEKKGVLYFNPGSATDEIFSPYRSYGILEVDDKIKAKIIRI